MPLVALAQHREAALEAVDDPVLQNSQSEILVALLDVVPSPTPPPRRDELHNDRRDVGRRVGQSAESIVILRGEVRVVETHLAPRIVARRDCLCRHHPPAARSLQALP